MEHVETVKQEDIRETNAKRILRVLSQRRAATHLAIAQETGMSVPTVTSIIRQFLEDGIVSIAGTSPSKRGRKAALIQFNPDARVVFAVDFSANHIQRTGMVRYVLANLDMDIRHEESFEYTAFHDVADIMDHLKHRFDAVADDRGIAPDRVLGVCFSLPGIINEEEKLLENDPNLRIYLGINELDFKPFSHLFPFPLYVENEAVAAALAEMNVGPSVSPRNLVYLAVNRGISAGIVINGKIYKGANRRAGLVGHLYYKMGTELCTCGRKGCWELYAATGALLRNYKRRTGETLESTSDFYRKLLKGEPAAFSVWDQYLEDFSNGIVNLMIAYDPARVIIGGEISLFEDVLLVPVREKVEEKSLIHGSSSQIEISALKNDASLLGAATIPINIFLTAKKSVYLAS